MDDPPRVRWPPGFEPGRAVVHVVNTAQARAGPERVWPWLARPERWPQYYANAWRVRHRGGPWPELAVGSTFGWWTFGIPITSVVTDCEPGARVAWTWTWTAGARGHHGFVLVPRAGGTLIRTEETVTGLPARLLAPVVRPVMAHVHQRWIEGAARCAAQPPTTRRAP